MKMHEVHEYTGYFQYYQILSSLLDSGLTGYWIISRSADIKCSEYKLILSSKTVHGDVFHDNLLIVYLQWLNTSWSLIDFIAAKKVKKCFV